MICGDVWLTQTARPRPSWARVTGQAWAGGRFPATRDMIDSGADRAPGAWERLIEPSSSKLIRW